MFDSNPDLSNPHILLDTLLRLREDVVREGRALFEKWRPLITRKSFLISGLNLAFYLALRQRDLRPIQTALTPWGLSSLGRSESRVLANLDAVITTLGAICRIDPFMLPKRPPVWAFYRGQRMLTRHTESVFGPAPEPRITRLMVTMPSEAASDYALIHNLLKNGMDCARINCAHDGSESWSAMIAHVRRAVEETGRPCKLMMDLGGPKARTGSIFNPKEKRLHPGDHILLTRGEPVPDRRMIQAQCAIPEVIDQLAIGASIWIDDGKIGARVEAIQPEGALLLITRTDPKGGKLKADKGLNFPDTSLRLSALTDKDRADLDFVAHHADIIGYSFVQEASDVIALQEELAKRLENPRKVAIVAKIETRRAIENLPEIIVHAAGKQPFGVMIARGDLAVEIGYDRLAEIQEEILWLCEAAQVPVIWATQVLEGLVKKGAPSRAEMTDAAMSERAECVMLNKGPYIVEAVSILDNVLKRMQSHQSKKTPQLRALRAWQQKEEIAT